MELVNPLIPSPHSQRRVIKCQSVACLSEETIFCFAQYKNISVATGSRSTSAVIITSHIRQELRSELTRCPILARDTCFLPGKFSVTST
jgi:hypothetical protein